jgi:hypothetical protein
MKMEMMKNVIFLFVFLILALPITAGEVVVDHDLCTQSVYLLDDQFEQIALLHEGLFDWWPKESFVFYTFYPPIESLRMAENFLFATTYLEKDQGHEIVVMDLTGQIIKRIYPHLPSFKYTKSLLAKDLYAFDQGKLYQLIQNKNTKLWELHINQIDY